MSSSMRKRIFEADRKVVEKLDEKKAVISTDVRFLPVVEPSQQPRSRSVYYV